MAAKKPGKRKVPARKHKGYASPAWERVYLLSLELDAIAQELGLHKKRRDPDGFDLADAAKELGRLAQNHNQDENPVARTAEQDREDWIAVGGIGADVGNMADEGAVGAAADTVRAIAHETCYLACDYLF
jgi:hypothetical protein